MRIVVLLFVLAVATVAVLHFTYPAAAAAGCPSCYGFTDLGDGIYVEGSMPPDRRAAAKATVEAARARVRAFYGDLQSSPRVLLCATEACYRPLGGGSRGVTLLDRALILSPRGADTVIAAHELAHAELHRADRPAGNPRTVGSAMVRRGAGRRGVGRPALPRARAGPLPRGTRRRPADLARGLDRDRRERRPLREGRLQGQPLARRSRWRGGHPAPRGERNLSGHRSGRGAMSSNRSGHLGELRYSVHVASRPVLVAGDAKAAIRHAVRVENEQFSLSEANFFVIDPSDAIERIGRKLPRPRTTP